MSEIHLNAMISKGETKNHRHAKPKEKLHVIYTEYTTREF